MNSNKVKRIITEMSELHPNESNEIYLLNWSFRQGDIPHSQWSRSEEVELIPLLVMMGFKPVASLVICSSKYCTREEACIYKQGINTTGLTSLVHLNKWGMYVLLLCIEGRYTTNMLKKLSNETLDIATIGRMYGYYE